jgi:hypothetical protein
VNIVSVIALVANDFKREGGASAWAIALVTCWMTQLVLVVGLTLVKVVRPRMLSTAEPPLMAGVASFGWPKDPATGRST